MSAPVNWNRTKIVCTIGPSSRPPEILERLIRAGMDVARLNFFHGTPKQHLRDFRNIRKRRILQCYFYNKCNRIRSLQLRC